MVELLSVKVFSEYKTLLPSWWSNQLSIMLVFLQVSLSPYGTSLSFLVHNLFPVTFLNHPGYYIFFCCSSTWGTSIGNIKIFNVWMVSWYKVSVGQCSMFNTKPTQFDIILSTTAVNTFPFFKARFNVVLFVNTIFPLLLPIGVPRIFW